MDLFKGKDNAKESSRILRGGYERMVKMRKEMRPEFEKEIQEAMDGWHGQSMALVIMNEDENGDVTGANIVSLGVSTPATQVALVKKLNELSIALLEQLTSTVGEDIDAMKALAEAMKSGLK